MTISTVSEGSSASFAVTDGQTVEVNNGRGGRARIEHSVSGVVAVNHAGRRQYGPFRAGTVTIFAAVNPLTYDFGSAPSTSTGDALSPTENELVRTLVAGTGIDVSFVRDFDGAALGYTMDAGSGQVLPVMRVSVEAPTNVIAGARISSGGINTFETTITGASLEGEVIPISVGSARITRVHVGMSTGASQTVSSDATVTTNELAAWSCLEADDCNTIFVRFSPPRTSGRYCDVTLVGKARV